MAKTPRRKLDTLQTSVIDEIDEAVTSHTTPPGEAPPAPKARQYPGIHRTTAYIPEPVHQIMRRVAFDLNIKEHDLIMQGLELLLTTKHGMPPFAELTKTEQTK